MGLKKRVRKIKIDQDGRSEKDMKDLDFQVEKLK